MIVVYLPMSLQQQVLEVLGKIEVADVTLSVKVKGDVGQGIIDKLKEIGCKIIEPVKP